MRWKGEVEKTTISAGAVCCAVRVASSGLLERLQGCHQSVASRAAIGRARLCLPRAIRT